MSNTVHQVRAYCIAQELFTQDSTIVVGLSGGPDSIALLSVLHTLSPEFGYRLIAAHLNHESSSRSEIAQTISAELCTHLGIEFSSTRISSLPCFATIRGSVEERWRLARRRYFEAIADTYNAAHIALGHHYNDQQETFFLRMVRGAHLTGLTAMRPVHGRYIRPLLECTKQELIAYCTEHNLTYYEDHTNQDIYYLRNAIRHNVLPALRASDKRFDTTFKKTMSAMKETEAYLERETQRAYTACVSSDQEGHALNLDIFLAFDPLLQPRVITTWLCAAQVPFTPSTGLFKEMVRFFNNDAPRHQVHPGWHIERLGRLCRITPPKILASMQ